ASHRGEVGPGKIGENVASFAGLAQLVEQRTCNAKVKGSTPLAGTSIQLERQSFGAGVLLCKRSAGYLRLSLARAPFARSPDRLTARPRRSAAACTADKIRNEYSRT